MHSDSGRSSRASSLHAIPEDAVIVSPKPSRPSSTKPAAPQDQYRNRYAQYLAAQFGCSVEACLADLDQQLHCPRRKSECSEAEVRMPELSRVSSSS